MKPIFNLLEYLQVSEFWALLLAKLISLAIFIFLIWLAGYIFRLFTEKYLIDRIFKGRFKKWHTALQKGNFFAAIGYFLAGILAQYAVDFFFPGEYARFASFGVKVVNVYFQICVIIIINKVIDIIISFYGNNPKLPVKGLMQAIKIVINFLGGLVILAWMLGKEPLFFISALGLAASVLMLVFKDPILGLTASFQLSFNDMLRIGDWIEMPKHGADGDVIDISLTSVRVQNWDKTIVSIPAYDLISSSFKNWRGMSDSGGRRIKRAINIDVQTIKFMDEDLFNRLKKIELLKEYLTKKGQEIASFNETCNVKESMVNGRHLTNVGTFRAYCEAYIGSRDYIHKTYTSMVRQLEPGSQGLPLEIYCFTNTTAWVAYEAHMSDLFDHLFAVMKDFDLMPFQNPSSGDIRNLSLKALPSAVAGSENK
ncbi:Putative mechano-sensitive ion channel [Elusimicrobium minutum Pei191]|uniref:Mechanosensing system component YbdG n=1 Tax=Elusimicrobium minutum (strain Pei191) TaxID=445932 RepID=B2KBX6_ELUMP|nr:mechanosensitive ion channel domain-containing protein [Elusimicrobium minutum]ACC97880.1 Putative mechano-sensitive ion channel [Elusimicrobium minutum Pei191]